MLYCTVLHCIVLYCTVLYWTVLKPSLPVLRVFLQWVASLRPAVFTVVESYGNFNSPFFVSRFTEVLGKIDTILHNIDGDDGYRGMMRLGMG